MKDRQVQLMFEIRDRIWFFTRIELGRQVRRHDHMGDDIMYRCIVSVYSTNYPVADHEEVCLGSTELGSLRPLNNQARAALAEVLLQVGGEP